MRSESDYKHIIKTSCEYQSGVAFLLEGLYQKGIPDMYITLKTAWPTLAEVKLERRCGLKFCRKIKYSKLQSDNMINIWRANILGALGLVVCEIDNDVALVALPPTMTHVKSSEISQCFVWLDKDRFDMDALFKAYHNRYIVPEREAGYKGRTKKVREKV